MKVRLQPCSTLSVALLATRLAVAISLDVNSISSIKQAASTVADGMVYFYTGGVPGQVVSQIPGLLPGPYYWWEAGAMFGALIDHRYYTNDDTYNTLITDALMFQVGPDSNFMPPNQTKSLGNDDQCFWAMAAMAAAETRFPNPPAESPQWLALAQGVFNSQADRWDPSTCRGGLRWQIFAFNNGYDYKNSISNGCFFNLAARLGAYTNNETYLEWARKVWDWTHGVGFIGSDYRVYDGSGDLNNCTDISPMIWTYNSGVMLHGAAVMYSQTSGEEQAAWEAHAKGLLDASLVFFKDNIMYEAACEPNMHCNTDQLSFKAYFSRWLAATAKIVPSVHDQILGLLQSSAVGAATSCSGGDAGTTCGTRWYEGRWDGTTGVGQQMSAMEVIQSLLLDTVSGPVSKTTGGISKGDPNAGTGAVDIVPLRQITNTDRAGAAVLTAVVLIFLLGGAWWLIS